MSKKVIRFEGPFAVWSYTVGHARLLLRRTKSRTMPTRLDVLFKNVSGVCLPMNMPDLLIEEASPDEAAQLLAGAGVVQTRDRKLFRISGSGWSGYIVAGVVVWNEDDGEYSDPSPLLD